MYIFVFFFYAMLQILIFNINNALKLLAAATSEAQGKVTFLNLSLDKSLRSKLMAFMLEMKQLRLREVNDLPKVRHQSWGMICGVKRCTRTSVLCTCIMLG